MGKDWEEHSRKELILNFNVIHLSLKEQVHFLARLYKGKYYALPEFKTPEYFESRLKPGCLDALETISEIWKKRFGDAPIPTVELVIMAKDQFDLRQDGWERFKELRVLAEKLKEYVQSKMNLI